MKRHASIVLVLYLASVFSYSWMEATHSLLHFLAEHHRINAHAHHHKHDHHLKDHHHIHAHKIHYKSLEHTAAEKSQVFFPLSYLEQNIQFKFPLSLLYKPRHVSNTKLLLSDLTPPNPPPKLAQSHS